MLVAGGVLLQTGAFSLVTLGRSGSVDIVNDDDGAVRLSINPCLRDKHRESLVTVTNRLAVTATYEVSLDLRGRTEYHSRNEVVPPMSRVYVREGETYSVRIHAEDAQDHADDVDLRDVRAPGVAPA